VPGLLTAAIVFRDGPGCRAAGQFRAGEPGAGHPVPGGRGLQRILPLRWIARLAPLAMVVKAGFTLAEALR
jgi:hypothetical protein